MRSLRELAAEARKRWPKAYAGRRWHPSDDLIGRDAASLGFLIQSAMEILRELKKARYQDKEARRIANKKKEKRRRHK